MIACILIISSCAVITEQVIKSKRNSFVQLVTIKRVVGENIAMTTASGFVVENRNSKSYIMTAGHFCLVPNEKGKWVAVKDIRVLDIHENIYKANVVGVSGRFDACLLETDDTGIEPLRVSRNDNVPGDRVINIAAPNGIFAKDLVLSYEGRYAGELVNDGVVHDTYNFPSTGGSSGSPILNQYGRVIGMVWGVDRRFSHITLSVTREQIILFLENLIDLKDFSTSN